MGGSVSVSLCRYDHYSALCELLPVGIPSLAVCLQTLVNGEGGAWAFGGRGKVGRSISSISKLQRTTQWRQCKLLDWLCVSPHTSPRAASLPLAGLWCPQVVH